MYKGRQLDQREGATADEATQLRWEAGVRHFFSNFNTTAWAEVEEQSELTPDQVASCGGRAPEEQDKIPRLARLSSHDLLVALDNALRSCNLSLRHFACGPQPLPGPLLTLSLDQARLLKLFVFNKLLPQMFFACKN